MRSLDLPALRALLASGGYTEGTPAFDLAFATHRIEHCVEVHNVATCDECGYQTECPLLREYRIALHSSSGTR